MSENVLEVMLEKIINNWKKYLGCILGFIIGLTIIKYGIIKAIIIFLFAFVGYKLGDGNFTKYLKKKIVNKLKEE